jgi:hypothetical protein
MKSLKCNILIFLQIIISKDNELWILHLHLHDKKNLDNIV